MIEHENVVYALIEDPNLVLRFFATFSRFEYSLKRSGFLKGKQKAEPNWDAYANSLRGSFSTIQDPSFRSAAIFLSNQPPRTQIVSGTHLDWEETNRKRDEQDENYILRLVKTVRNNLFHGGKYPTGPVVDVGRNRDLLEASITVLEQCLELSPEVQAVFAETAQVGQPGVGSNIL